MKEIFENFIATVPKRYKTLDEYNTDKSEEIMIYINYNDNQNELEEIESFRFIIEDKYVKIIYQEKKTISIAYIKYKDINTFEYCLN
jgi:hypothetical protein